MLNENLAKHLNERLALLSLLFIYLFILLVAQEKCVPFCAEVWSLKALVGRIEFRRVLV